MHVDDLLKRFVVVLEDAELVLLVMVLDAPVPHPEAVLKVDGKVRRHRAEAEEEGSGFLVLQTFSCLRCTQETVEPPRRYVRAPRQAELVFTHGLCKKCTAICNLSEKYSAQAGARTSDTCHPCTRLIVAEFVLLMPPELLAAGALSSPARLSGAPSSSSGTSSRSY